MTQPDMISGVRSMTGQGHAERRFESGTMGVEVRTVNHRGFKWSPRLSESLLPLESRIESVTRSMIRRGSVHLSVNWQRPPGEGLPRIDRAALETYYGNLREVRDSVGESAAIDLTALVALPGVMAMPQEDRRDDEALWEAVRQTVVAAIENLNAMRTTEGAAMAGTLLGESAGIRRRVASIADLAPRVVAQYRDRLQGKIQRALAEHNLDVPPSDLLREVQIYADRADVSEEITRLDSHLEMFESVLGGEPGRDGEPEPLGRKLDFIIQEMFRETNTIGSKASDADVSAHVVEIKCGIERMRELVQNLE